MEPGDGWYRHLTHPCVGAIEFEFETTDIDAAGRVQRRTVAGRTYDYQQDAMGRLTAYTDYQNASNNATYSYDYRSRRVAMTVGGITTRFVYDGDDVVAEFVDEDADNQPDRMRYYWNLPGIDQRIGFVDVDVDTGVASYYYYLTDQIGSVIAVVDADGDIVNRYDYDAFGNLRRGTSWETVPNRYRFQGREYDAHRGDYYFRLRTYIPEWGMFSGPDFQLDPFDPNGACNYLFANNNPLVFRDPTGLMDVNVVVLVGPKAGLASNSTEWKDFLETLRGGDRNSAGTDRVIVSSTLGRASPEEITRQVRKGNVVFVIAHGVPYFGDMRSPLGIRGLVKDIIRAFRRNITLQQERGLAERRRQWRAARRSYKKAMKRGKKATRPPAEPPSVQVPDIKIEDLRSRAQLYGAPTSVQNEFPPEKFIVSKTPIEAEFPVTYYICFGGMNDPVIVSGVVVKSGHGKTGKITIATALRLLRQEIQSILKRDEFAGYAVEVK